METQTKDKHKITANAYVLSQYSKLGRGTRIVGVYPTREAAELAKTQQDKFGGVINHIHETTLYGADDLDLRHKLYAEGDNK